jgi:nucleoside-diphosphate-sugar epimerase
VQTAIVRPKTFLGPGRVGGFALAFASVRSGGTVPIAGPGTNRYQYVHVDDLADGVVRLADAAAEGVFHFGAPDVETVRSELSALIDAAGTGARALFLPPRVGQAVVRAVELAGLPPLSEFHHAAASGWDSVVDSSRAMAELQWLPARSNLDTLLDAYAWYSDNADRGSITTHPVPVSHRVARRVLALASSGSRRRDGRTPVAARR